MFAVEHGGLSWGWMEILAKTNCFSGLHELGLWREIPKRVCAVTLAVICQQNKDALSRLLPFKHNLSRI